MRTKILSAFLFICMITHAFGSGVVAETNRGTLVTLEFESYGTGEVQQFGLAHLKVIDKAGKILYQEEFSRDQGSNVTMKHHKNGQAEISLTIQSKKSVMDLQFKGEDRRGNEIDGLIKILKMKDRRLEPGSLLTLKTPAGKFSFKDVIGAVYGDL